MTLYELHQLKQWMSKAEFGLRCIQLLAADWLSSVTIPLLYLPSATKKAYFPLYLKNHAVFEVKQEQENRTSRKLPLLCSPALSIF